MMARGLRATAGALAAATVLAGCAVGYNRTLFVTKTNLGFEVSNTPPTFELALSRVEGVIGPQFENGQTLPVMASFKFRTSGAFSPAVGSAFATGDAATTMSALYGDPTPSGDWQTRGVLLKDGTLPTDSTLRLEREPTIPGNALFTPTFQKQDVRPVFFGTDTSLGVKVAWSGMTGTFPDTARFGYHRKELAFVPIAMSQRTTAGAGGGTRTTFDMKMSSLMATVDSGVTDVKAGGAPEFGYRHIQYFATGSAATLLSMQQDVRMAMLARLDPNKEIQKRLFGHLLERSKTVAVVLLNPLYRELQRQPATDAVAKTLLQRMDAVAPAGLAMDFKRYQYANGGLTDTEPFAPAPPEPFLRFHYYVSNLDLAIEAVEGALADPQWSQFNSAAIQDRAALRAQMEQALADLKRKRDGMGQLMEENSAVFRDAVDYFYR
jgi:hypothetical protein